MTNATTKPETKNLGARRPRGTLVENAGFTLLEIMIVLGIIAMIFGFLVLPAITGKSEKARIKMTQVKLTELAASYERWSVDHYQEDCPSDLNALVDSRKKSDLKDGWGKPFVMRCGNDAPEGEGFGVTSGGPDKKVGTEDDLNSWDEAGKDK